jgi:putative transposase
MLARRFHTIDLSDEEWKILKPLVPEAKPGGDPRAHQTRELLKANFYVLRGGCFSPPLALTNRPPLLHKAWRIDGTWERIHRPSREATPPGGQKTCSQHGDHQLPNVQDY